VSVQLYPDQLELVTRVRAAMRQHKRVLMQSATGSGKTRMTADMIAGTVKKGTTSIFTVPRKELLRQTIATIAEYGMPFGVISPDHAPNPFAKTQIAMTQTLAKRLDKITPPDVLFIDECHYGGAELDRIIAWATASGCWIVGMSATPLKTNGRGMCDWYDVMVDGLPVADLIAMGRLSEYRYFAPDTPDFQGIATRNGDYAHGQIVTFMEKNAVITGSAVDTYRKTAMGKLNVTFCTSRKHSSDVTDAFNAAGIPAAFIDGTMGDDQRGRIIGAFARREILSLQNVDLLTFGFDLSAAAKMDVTVESMSDLRPTKSLPLQLQKWGRVLRKKGFAAIINDHVGNHTIHGLPDDGREWTLAGAVKRGKAGEKSIPVLQCPMCHFVSKPRRICGNIRGETKCDYEFEVKSRMIDEIDGELTEIDRERARKQKRMEQGRAETLADLIAFGERTGKKPGWARHVWAAREAKRMGAR